MEEKCIARDFMGNLQEGFGTLMYTKFLCVSRLHIYEGEKGTFCIDIHFEHEDGGLQLLKLINGFECFCKTMYSNAIYLLLIDNGFNEEEVKKIFDESLTSLTLTKPIE